MGNGSSSRRNGRAQLSTQGPPPPPRMVPPPPGYPSNHAPYPGPPLYPSNGHHAPFSFYTHPNYGYGGGIGPLMPQLSPPGYMPPPNGQYMMGPQQGFRPVAPSPAPPPTTPPVAETQNANTIRNDVNLKKATLRLEKDDENPGFHVVAFSFDANVAGSISIFFLAREEEQCAFSPLKPQLYKVQRVPFEKGLVQKFQQATGSGVNLAMFDERDLFKERDKHVFPLVVRMETVGNDAPPDYSIHDEVPVDQSVPKWVNCQTTQAVIEKKDDGSYKTRVIRQTVWIDGEQYEIEEIYGIENSGGAAGFEGNDAGKECVICMSEPRDTTVLPCRHMCMCSECAKVLRYQTNRCPICRTPVERLLEIKVPKAENLDLLTTHDTTASQSSGLSNTGQTSSSPHRSAQKEETQIVKR